MIVLLNRVTGQPTIFAPPEWMPHVLTGPYQNVAEVSEEWVAQERARVAQLQIFGLPSAQGLHSSVMFSKPQDPSMWEPFSPCPACGTMLSPGAADCPLCAAVAAAVAAERERCEGILEKYMRAVIHAEGTPRIPMWDDDEPDPTGVGMTASDYYTLQRIADKIREGE